MATEEQIQEFLNGLAAFSDMGTDKASARSVRTIVEVLIHRAQVVVKQLDDDNRRETAGWELQMQLYGVLKSIRDLCVIIEQQGDRVAVLEENFALLHENWRTGGKTPGPGTQMYPPTEEKEK